MAGFLWLSSFFFVFKCAREALSSIPATGSASPIRHWDTSWTASCARGTAVALAHQDGMILFLRSPSSNVWKAPLVSPSSDTVVKLSGLSVMPVQSNQIQFAPSWVLVSNSFCAMTGFASDVEHLARILQLQADQYYNIYDRTLTTHGMTQCLSRVLQQAALAKGGRPFGVQALLAGGDDIDHPQKTWCLYSLDPSGGWQSWGGETAIGKYAKQIRDKLAEKRKLQPLESLEQSLERILQCWLETCQQENVNLRDSDEDYQVFILKSDPETKRCKLYVVNEDNIKDLADKAKLSLAP